MERLKINHRLPKILLSALVLLFSIRPVYAAWWNPLSWIAGIWNAIWDILGEPIVGLAASVAAAIVQMAAGVINAVIGLVTSMFFAIASLFIGLAIKFNEQIKDIPIIKEGHDIVLAVANLGLVAGIIIIAFLVMFRRGTAGQYLIRFIAAALLINFGFFIITNVFMAPVDALTGVLNKATNFSPASFLKVFLLPAIDPNNILANIGDSVESGGQGALGEIAASLASVFFTLVFGILGTLALFAFAVMLFIRGIALGFLLIVLPLAWVSWIFPTLKIPGGSPWSLWWHQFTKWLLFAPFAMFFFFLSVKLAQSPALFEGSSGGSPGFTEAVAGMTVVAGLMVGGLLVSSKMGIMGSGYAKAVAKKGGNWAKARGRVMAIGAISAPFRGEKGGKRAEKLQGVGVQRGLMGRLMTAPIRLTGRQLNVLGAAGEKAVKKEGERGVAIFKDDPVRAAQAVPAARGAELVALLDMLRKNGSLGLIPEESVGIARLIGNPGVEKLYKRLGRGGDYENLEKAAGFNTAVIHAARAFEEETGTLDDLREAVDAFQQATYQSAKDVEALQTRIFRPGNQYGFRDATRQVIAEGVGQGVLMRIPETTARFRTKMNAAELEQFQGVFDKTVQDFETRTRLPAHLSGPRVEVKQKLDWLDDQAARAPAGSRAATTAARHAILARKLYKQHEQMLGAGLLYERPTPSPAPATPATP